MLRILLISSAAILCASAALAEGTPQECSTISDSLQRLTCFDKLFPKSDDTEEVKSVEAASEVTNSPWEITEEKSPIDDSPRVSGYLLPKDSGNKLNIMGSPGIGLRCHDNKTMAVILTGEFSAADTSKVTYRINDNVPATSAWRRSDNYKAVGLWSGAQAIPFMKQLKNNGTLAIQIDNPRVEMVFELGNVEDIVTKIATACKWK